MHPVPAHTASSDSGLQQRSSLVRLRPIWTDTDVIMAPDPDAGPLTAVDRLLLEGCVQELKALGHYRRYQRLVDASDMLEQAEAPWIASDVMRRHYGACDALALPSAQIMRVRRRVRSPARQRLVATLESTARVLGFNPWIAIAPMHRIACRVFRGGSSELVKLGPKDLQLTFYGNPLFESAYFRASCAGTLRQMFGLLGVRSSHVEISRETTEQTSVIVSWV